MARLRIASPVVVVLMAAGCTTLPGTSAINREMWSATQINRYPLVVTRIDGVSPMISEPTYIDPGKRVIRFSAPPVAGFREPVEKEYTLDIEPCRNYWVSAERESPLSPDWTLRIDHSEPLAGCDPAKATIR